MVMMGGDGDLGKMVAPDLKEMAAGISEDLCVLALVDLPEGRGVGVLEVCSEGLRRLEMWDEISTGDPRPLADFLARALVSFSSETMIAIGFWGHGKGVFGDFDPDEVLLSREARFGSLGVALNSDAMVQARPRQKRALKRSMLPDMTSGNALTNREASSALTAAFARARRTQPVDLLFFDACLNSSIEVFTELRGFAKSFVASALMVPGTGWNYAYWLAATAKELPATSRDWASLAVAVFGAEYDPRVCEKPAQLFATSTTVDFVGAFGVLVSRLLQLGEEGAQLAGQAAREVQTIKFGENLDFGQLVERIKDGADGEVESAADRVVELYEESAIGISMAPAGCEALTGMTIWCPLDGDKEGVSRYYGELEFARVTGWLELLQMGSTQDPPRDSYGMFGFWGLELVEERGIEETAMGGDRVLLAIPDACRYFTRGLVEGEYRFHGGSGSIEFRNYVALREFVRSILEIREGKEFESLRGCCERGWVIGGEVCGEMAQDLRRYEAQFRERASLAEEVRLYANVRSCFEKVAQDGVLIFG